MHQFLAAKEIGDDEIGAHSGQALSLPFIYYPAFRLGGRDPDGHAAHLLMFSIST